MQDAPGSQSPVQSGKCGSAKGFTDDVMPQSMVFCRIDPGVAAAQKGGLNGPSSGRGDASPHNPTSD
jgi:hypothetical protein